MAHSQHRWSLLSRYRHEFYETDEKLTLSIFDRGADPAQVSITFQPRKVIHNLSSLKALSPGLSSLLIQMARNHLSLSHLKDRLTPIQAILQWVKSRSKSGSLSVLREDGGILSVILLTVSPLTFQSRYRESLRHYSSSQRSCNQSPAHEQPSSTKEN